MGCEEERSRRGRVVHNTSHAQNYRNGLDNLYFFINNSVNKCFTGMSFLLKGVYTLGNLNIKHSMLN